MLRFVSSVTCYREVNQRSLIHARRLYFIFYSSIDIIRKCSSSYNFHRLFSRRRHYYWDIIMSEQDKGECRVCGAETGWLCPLCKEIWRCGRDHQKSDWKQHKQSCKEHQRKIERSIKAKEDNIFHAGDRVVLRGLKNASHMNQRHGRVVSEIDTKGRYKVILDLMSDPDVNPRVLPVNLRHCEKVINIETQAGTENGLLEKESGMAVFGILDVLRMCSYYYVEGGPQVESTNEIAEMRENNEDGTFVNMAAAWEYWNIKTPGRSKTIYNFAKELVQHNNIHNSVRNDPLQHRARLIITEAMDKKVACKSWHLRIHGVFWIIDVHKDGTYLVPEDKNQDYLKVYQALGVGDTLWSLVCNSGNNGNAFRGVITLVPWYGRLVYDGCLQTRLDLMPFVAPDDLTATLREAVSLAKREGRVIKGLVQLEE